MSRSTAPTIASNPPSQAFLGWGTYPERLPSFSPFDCDASLTRERLNEQQQLIFSDGDVEIDVIDARESDQFKSIHQTFYRQEDVEHHIQSSVPELRIISIVRKNSQAPLLVTKELLWKLLQFHAVGPCFLDLLLAFRTGDELSEKGASLWSPLKRSRNEYEICYQMKYMERNDHKHGQKWSERQVGVYHRFGGSKKATVVLIHANPSTKALLRLQKAFAEGQYQHGTATSPLSLHTLILGSYLDNWRTYLQELGSWCLKKENQFLTVGLKHPSLTFKELQELRDLESRLLVAAAILQSTVAVIQAIEVCGRSLQTLQKSNAAPPVAVYGDELAALEAPEMQCLRVLHFKCEGYLQSVQVIQNRVKVVIGLLSDGLNQQSQHTANRIADSSHALTLKSVNDNYIVQVVTVITLIYLPMQGVATFFGMNFTGLSGETNELEFARNWWMFLITAIPLTIVTIGGLVIAMRLEKRRKKNDPVQKMGRA